MKVYLITRPQFVQLPPELGVPRSDQLVGTDAEQVIELAGRACFDPQTEILTRKGWVPFPALREGDEVAAVAPDATFAWERIGAPIEKDHDGGMIKVAARDVDFMVTPDHRMVVRPLTWDGEPGEWQIAPAADLLRGRWAIRGSATLKPTVLFPSEEGFGAITESVARFLGWFVAEGSLNFSKGSGANVTIYQRPGVNLNEITACIAEMGYTPGIYEDPRNGVMQVKIGNTELAHRLAEWGKGQHERRVPPFLYDCPIAIGRAFLDALFRGDAHHRNEGTWVYPTVSEGLAHDVARLATQCGYQPTRVAPIALPPPGSESWTRRQAWRVGIGVEPRLHLIGAKVKAVEVPYRGKVYCCSVSTGRILVRRNGKQMICGQCYDSLGKGRNSAEYHQHILDVGHGCYDVETDVLTAEGWKAWPDVSLEDRLATRSPAGRIEYQSPSRLVRYKHTGAMYRVESKGMDLLVTPDHRMLACPTTTRAGREREDFSLVTAETLGTSAFASIKCGTWLGGAESTQEDRDVMALLGFAIGDGNIGERGLTVRFHLRRSRKILWLRDLANRLGWPLVETDGDRFTLHVPEKAMPLFKAIYDEDKEKVIPPGLLMQSDQPALEALLHGLIQSDGSVGATGTSYDSTSQKLIGQIQHLALHVGLAANIGYTLTDRETSYGTKPLTRLHLVRRNLRPEVNKYVGGVGRMYRIEGWSGEVFCAEVPNGTLYVRRAGKPVWSGNSVLEHPQFTFFITGVSRGLTHELVRHRVGLAISQRSTRYVDEDESPWIPHPLLQEVFDEAKRADVFPGDGLSLLCAWDDAVEQCRSVYKRAVKLLEARLIGKGIDKLSARKQARGAARGVLGNALETELVWSANVRTIRHVLEMRASDAADAEIRAMAVALYYCVRDEVPAYMRDYILAPATDGLGETLTTPHQKV